LDVKASIVTVILGSACLANSLDSAYSIIGNPISFGIKLGDGFGTIQDCL